jgi:hypothetical protein
MLYIHRDSSLIKIAYEYLFPGIRVSCFWCNIKNVCSVFIFNVFMLCVQDVFHVFNCHFFYLMSWMCSVCVFVLMYIVAYRAVAKRWLCKQRPFLGNGWVTMFRGNEYARNNRVTVGNGVFSRWFVPKCYTQGTKLVQWRRKEKSQIWDSKIWSRVSNWGPRKTTLTKASIIYKKQTRPLFRENAPDKQDLNVKE